VVISINELEAAINYWRQQNPAQGEAHVLCPQATALSRPYALMIFNGQRSIDTQLLDSSAQAAFDAYLQRLSN